MSVLATRITLGAGNGVLLLLYLATAIGMRVPGCSRGCSVDARPGSWLPAVLGILLVIAIVTSAWRGLETMFRWSVAMGAIGAAVAAWTMFASGSYCGICATVQSGFLLLTLTLIRAKAIPTLLTALYGLAGWVFVLGVPDVGPPRTAWIDWQPRAFEVQVDPSKTYYVVYTDPMCPHCKELAQTMLSTPDIAGRLFFRWKFVTPQVTTARHIAMLYETLADSDPAMAKRVLAAIYRSEDPPSEDKVELVAASFGVGDQWHALLSAPPPALLARLEHDGVVFDGTHAKSVPTVFSLTLASWKVQPPRLDEVSQQQLLSAFSGTATNKTRR